MLLHIHHTYQPDGPAPGAGFDREILRAALERAAPDVLQVTAKSQSGYVPYPTYLGNQHPAAIGDEAVDLLAGYREITTALGIRLVLGYSGLVDRRAAGARSEWLRVSYGYNPYPSRALCPNSGYVDELLLPQLEELNDRYQPDGFWLDAGAWTVAPCYCPVCASDFQLLHERSAPIDRDDELWPDWLRFHRESFERHLQRVARFLEDRNSLLEYADNAAYATHQPAVAPYGLKRLTWDLSPAFALPQAGLEARWFDRQGLPFDLLSWARCSPRPQPATGRPALPAYPKSAAHLSQEAATVLAGGGAWGVAVTAYADGSLPESDIALAGAALEFARGRAEWTAGTESAAYVAVLHGDLTHHRAGNGLFDPGPCLDRIRGAHLMLAELHHPHDVVGWPALSHSLERYQVVVLPEQIALPPDADAALTEWVRGGGILIASGRVSPRIIEDVPTFALEEALGVRWTGHQEPEAWVQHRGLPLRVAAPTCRVVCAEAEPVRPLLVSGHEARQQAREHPAVTRRTFGEGQAVYLAPDLFAAYQRCRFPGLRDLVGDLLAEGLGQLPLSTDAPTWVEAVLRVRPGALLVHLVNQGPGKSQAQNSAFVEALPRTGPVRLGLALGAAPTAVRLQPGGVEPEWGHAGEVLHVTVPEVGAMTTIEVGISIPPAGEATD
jgi:hypothetical protein